MRVLALVTAISASAVTLPTPDDYSGPRTVCPSFLMDCECTTMSSGVIVSCSLKDRSQLRSTMKDLKGFNLQQFTMTKSNISIENGDFAGVTLSNMDVDSSTFVVKTINDGFLVDKSNNLKSLKFQNSQVAFRGTNMKNTNLSSLWFNNCEFTSEFSPTWFDGLSVTWLRITNSQRLNMAIASKVQNIEKYTHTASNLVKLDRSMLPETPGNIVELDFSTNNITSIESDFLKDLKKLKRLDLSNNKLETLSEETFGNFTGNLYVSNNRLKCNSSLHWLADRLRNKTFNEPDRYTCTTEGGRTQSIRDLLKLKLD